MNRTPNKINQKNKNKIKYTPPKRITPIYYSSTHGVLRTPFYQPLPKEKRIEKKQLIN